MQSFSKGQRAALLVLLIAVIATITFAATVLILPRNQSSTSSQASTRPEQSTPTSPAVYSPEPAESVSTPPTASETPSLPTPSAVAPTEQSWAEPIPTAFEPPSAAAPPAPYPTALEPQAPPEPEPEPSCPAGLVRVALTSVTFAPDQYGGNYSVITAKGTVTNETSAAVTMFDDDVPDFEGLDSRGEPAVMQSYGQWDWNPPAGQPRPTYLRLEPAQKMSYMVTDMSSNSTINEVKYWFADGGSASFEASFDFDGPYWDCPDPLPSEDGAGHSIPATNLPPVVER